MKKLISNKNGSRLKNSRFGLKVLARYLQPYRKDLLLVSVLGSISALVNGFLPYLSGKLLDSIITPNYFGVYGYTTYSYVVFLMVWLLAQALANVLDWKNAFEGEKLAAYIYSDYISHGAGYILNLPIAFHKDTKSGSVDNKLQKTANAFYNLTSAVIIILPQFLTIVVASAILFLLNKFLMFVLIGGVLVYIVLLVGVLPKAELMQRQMWDYWDDTWSSSRDALNNIGTIKQAGTEEYEKDKIREGFFGKALKVDLGLTALWNNLDFSQRIIILITQILVFVFSIIAISNGTMTVGELVAFNGYAAMFFGPFVILGKKWQNIQNGAIYSSETEKILSLPQEAYEGKKNVKSEIFKKTIEFHNVYFHYDKQKPVLSGVSFKVEPGETVALIGKSGEGKTTLLDLLSGYYFPQKGKILIGGLDYRQIGLRQLRAHIGVVPQEVVLFNDTIKKNLAYTKLSASQTELELVAQQSHSLGFIEKFPKKWKQIVGERGVKLSVGQKQRVAIARAILRDPDILILDEPTSALDAESEHFITQSLQELMKGRTTFIIAHRLSTVRRADKIIVLKDGQIAEMGNHDQLMAKENGLYRHLYDLQVNKKEGSSLEDGGGLLENEKESSA